MKKLALVVLRIVACGLLVIVPLVPGSSGCSKAETPMPPPDSPGTAVSHTISEEARSVTFSGNVIDLQEQPVAGARLALYPSTGGHSLPDQSAQGRPPVAPAALSDASGSFEILDVPPGTYRFNASHPDFAPTVEQEVVLEAGRDRSGHTVRLLQGGCIVGIPLIEGVPAQGRIVMASGTTGIKQATTDENGRFEICKLAPGTYTVQVMDSSTMTSGNLSVPLQRTAEVQDAQTTEIDFAPPAGSVTVEGSVGGLSGGITTLILREPESPPMEGIDPFNMAQQAEMTEHIDGVAILRADGTFSMPNVLPGSYLLEVYHVSIDPANPSIRAMRESSRKPVLQKEIVISPGEQQRIELQVP